MKLDHALILRQQQTLTMTPQLQQSLKLLQMSTLEITEYIEQQLMDNPLLQRDESSFSEGSAAISRDSSNDDWIEKTVANVYDLRHHLLQQLHVTALPTEQISWGERLIDLIDDDGYLRSDLGELSLELQVSEGDLLAVLSTIQTFDPIGVGARNLVECLAIQLRETMAELPAADTILEHLEDLPTLGLEKLSKRCKITTEECQSILHQIRSLNPRPGMSFTPVSMQVRIPDVFVKRNDEGRFLAELNEESLPRILVDSVSYNYYLKSTLSEGDRQYLKGQYQQASWLVRSLYQRIQTVMRVADALVDYQQEFFEKGMVALRPLTLRELSETLGVHESTISRAITGKYMSTPQGIVEFKQLLSSSVDKNNSAAQIQHMIKMLVQKEDPQSPLSDDQLVCGLKTQGITVARRTIAKYREQLGIESSFDRKKRQINLVK